MQSSDPLQPVSARPKLKTQFQTVCRRKGYTLATERTYWRWVVRFVRFHGTRHPLQLGADAIRRFLSYLAAERNVASATQNQALNALIFLYEAVLGEEIGAIGPFERAQAPKRLPTVLTKGEVRAVLDAMSGPRKLVASLLYGAGLRLSEALRLRVKDLRFERHQLIVRRGKGQKDRVTMLPAMLHVRCSASSARRRRGTPKTSKRATGPFICHTRCAGSTQMRRRNGHGSGSFHRPSAR